MFQFMLMVQLLVKFRFFIHELWERKSLQILYECWRQAYHALLTQLFIFLLNYWIKNFIQFDFLKYRNIMIENQKLVSLSMQSILVHKVVPNIFYKEKFIWVLCDDQVLYI